MSSGSKYWRERTLQVNEVLMSKGDDYFHRLEREYTKAAKKLNGEITVLYSRLADNNNISMKEAQKLLNDRELKEFRWKVEEYIEKGSSLSKSKEIKKQLENASLRYRISRLEAMKVLMQSEVDNLLGHELDDVSKLMADIYTDGYYRTAHCVQTGLGVGYNFATIDTNQVEKILSKPWVPDGRNFSQRIWGIHRPKLVKELETGLAQAIIRGEKPTKLIDRITNVFGVARHRAANLVYTEMAYFSGLSQQDNYKEMGVETQEFCATLDLRTSEICQEMDGKVIETKDVEIGVNAPPLHCRCRSTMVPYFEDMEGERFARNTNGEAITVPSTMTYKDWYEKFIAGTAAGTTKVNTFKSRVDSIKKDLTGHKQTLTSQKTTLKNKKAELKTTRDEIQNLVVEQMDLQLDRDKYNSLKDIDFDAEINNLIVDETNLKSKVASLQSTHDKYFNKPDRGTAAYDEWRNWKKGVDYEKLFNELIDAESELRSVTSNITLMRDRQAFVKGIDIDDLNKKLSDIDDALVGKRNLADAINSDIAKLGDDIADTRLTIEGTYQRAGKEFIVELDNVELIGDEDVDKLRAKRDDVFKEYMKESDQEKKLALYDKYKELNNECTELRKRQPMVNSESVKSVVAQVRSVGAEDVDELVKVHLKNSRASVRDAVVNAYNVYPTDWVNASAARGTLTLKKVDRGYYDNYNDTIAISGIGDSQQFRTAIHELGHRFEDAVKGMLDVEKTFYDRRTKGEALQWLGTPYSKSEKARFDDFIVKYMGKDYSETAYEIVSMGFEYGYIDPKALLKDRDMAELIYGILATL